MNFKELRRVIFALGFILAYGGAGCLSQSLREFADKDGILIGTAVNPYLFSEDAYARTLAREFNMVEPENVMKWGIIRRTRDAFNFGPGDQIVAFAKAHDMKVRGHCLVWGKYNPVWLAKGSFTPEELSALLNEHITTVAKHFAGQVFAWDVFNEAFDAKGGFEHSIWYDQPGIGLSGKGTAFIEQAFRIAHAADPGALLFYNDYAAEGMNAKSDAIYSMVKDFKKRGVPIDGVGLQMHIFNLGTKEIATVDANIKRLTYLGLQVHITEMDVGLQLGPGGQLLDSSDLTKQADIYRVVAATCLRNPGCKAIQTWGFTDKYSWIPGYTNHTKGSPLLFDQLYSAKPSYKALLEVLQQHSR